MDFSTGPGKLSSKIRLRLSTGMENVLYKTIVHIMSKVIRDCCDFAFLRSVIGVENLHHSLDQSDARLKAITS